MHSRKVVELSPRFNRRRNTRSDILPRSFDMGVEARLKGKSKESCPFSHGVARREWMRGYNEG